MNIISWRESDGVFCRLYTSICGAKNTIYTRRAYDRQLRLELLLNTDGDHQASTHQMKSLQWLQKVGCLKNRAANL